MTRIAEIADRLHRLAKRREDEGIYTDAALCEEAAAYLSAALTAEPGEAVAWQWRYKYDDGKWGGWQNERRADADALLRENVLIAEESRPLYIHLYAHPSPEAKGGRS